MPFGTKEEIAEAKKNPQFKYIELECWDKHQGNDGGFILNWGVEHLGFGQIAFYIKDGKIICDTECMSKEFVEKAMKHFLDNVKYRD